MQPATPRYDFTNWRPPLACLTSAAALPPATNPNRLRIRIAAAIVVYQDGGRVLLHLANVGVTKVRPPPPSCTKLAAVDSFHRPTDDAPTKLRSPPYRHRRQRGCYRCAMSAAAAEPCRRPPLCHVGGRRCAMSAAAAVPGRRPPTAEIFPTHAAANF